jgi:hypothetical protein
MRSLRWKQLSLMLFSGAILLQVPACAETAYYLSTLANVVTAGGVVYLVTRVID